MKRSALFILSLALSAPVWAEPVTYVIDNNHSFERFSYSHMGFSTQLSRFDKTSGTIMLDAAARTASVDVTIDLKSVSTGSELFNGHIQGPDFLDTANYPTATFKSTAVKFDGDRPVSIAGDLTIKGITKPVTLTVTAFHTGVHPMMKKNMIGADATAQIKRSDFNAGKYAPMTSDEVTLSIAVEAVQK